MDTQKITKQYYAVNKCGNPDCKTVISEKKDNAQKPNSEYTQIYMIDKNGSIVVCAVCRKCYKQRDKIANKCFKHFTDYRKAIKESTSELVAVFGSRQRAKQARKELLQC